MEGTSQDSFALRTAYMNGLDRPVGKFRLADAGYGLTEWTLMPHRGTRYHLSEWKQANMMPSTPKELFNFRHAVLRNVVERVNALLKVSRLF